MCASAILVSGPLDCGLLQTSIERVVWRHEALRTRFVSADGAIWQHIDAPEKHELKVVDLSDLPQVEARREAKRLAQDFQHEKIDLSIGPVFEARLFKLSTHQHVLVLLVDHMVSDGISNALLSNEVWNGYDAALCGAPYSMPPLPVQFADYAVWQERARESSKRELEAYWKEHLAGVSCTTIPVSHESPNAKPASGVTIHFPFGGPLSARLREAAERAQTPPSIIGLTIYAVAMSHWCRQEDLFIRCPVHGRQGRPELKNVVGFLVNRLYLRIRVRSDDTLQNMVAQIHREMNSALEHRDFDTVPDFISECGTELEFQWRSVNWPGRLSNPQPKNDSPIKRQPFFVRLPEWPWNFWSAFDDTPAGIIFTAHYWPHVLARSDVERFTNNMRTIAELIVERPFERVGFTAPSDIRIQR